MGRLVQRLIDVLPAYPILSAATASEAIGSSQQVARLAIEPLVSASILSQISLGRRNRAWAAKELFQVINAFEWDIARPDEATAPRRPSPTRGRTMHQ